MIWKKIAVDRDILNVDRHYYDLYMDNDGFGGNFLWKTGFTWRHPISLIKDSFLRKKYGGMSIEGRLKSNEKNFYIKFEEIQGVVDDDIHKLFEVLTNSELIRLIFRNIGQYDSFSENLSSKLGDKHHKKEIEVLPSVKQGYN